MLMVILSVITYHGLYCGYCFLNHIKEIEFKVKKLKDAQIFASVWVRGRLNVCSCVAYYHPSKVCSHWSLCCLLSDDVLVL